MHPVLVEVPFPHGSVALTPWLVALSLLSLVVCGLGRYSKSPDLFWTGLAGFALAFAAAVAHRGDRIEIGPMPIYSFGALLSSALLAGWVLTVRFARADGLPERATVNACLAAALTGFAGARLLYVFTNIRDVRTLGDVLAVQSGGLTFYGGLGAGAVGAWWMLRKHRASFLAWGDAAAPGVALALGIGRIGCYLAGCDYGTPLSVNAPAWLRRIGTFPRWPDDVAGAAAGSPAWVDHVLARRVPLAAKTSLPVHPAELYEATLSFVLFAVLLALRSRRRFRGQTFAAFVLGYGSLRFLLELVRGDSERGLWGPLSASQWLALASSALAVAGVWRILKESREVREPA